MFNSQVYRKVWLALGATAVLLAGGCSSKPAAEAEAGKTAAPAKPKPAVAAKPAEAVAKAPEPAAMVTVPKGTAINATVVQTLTTDKNKVGDTFAVRLATPIQVDGKTVVPKGAHVTGRIVTVKKHELKVTLASVVIHGKSYPLDTNSVAGPKNNSKNEAKGTEKTNKNVTILAGKSELKFKLEKPVTFPAKG